jgi:Zn-dependent protease with chaperone function
MASAFVKFALDSKVDPTPNRFIEFWRYSHPSLTRRIEFVRHYKPWEAPKK